MTERQPDEHVKSSLEKGRDLMEDMLGDGAVLRSVEQFAETAAEAYRSRGKLLLFGNGGSAADSVHIAAEFVGRFLTERQPLPALSLAANMSAVTAIGNDYGYEEVFARQVRALGNPGDIAIGLSTSGNSENVSRGLAASASAGLATVALTGANPGPVGDAADQTVAIPSQSTPYIQMGHMAVGHLVCEWVEAELIAGRI